METNLASVVLYLITNGFGQLKADGSMDLKINVREDQIADAVKWFGKKGKGVFLSLAVEQEEKEPARESKGKYSLEAQKLKQSSFFRTPEVWKAIGTDEEFLAYLRLQPCAYCHSINNVEAAHVRRIANGSGVALKPQYSSIPLCHICHSNQHNHGESIIGTKEWFDKKRIEYVSQWAWESLKEQLGFAHWYDIEPWFLYQWARDHDLLKYLPECYKKGEKDVSTS